MKKPVQLFVFLELYKKCLKILSCKKRVLTNKNLALPFGFVNKREIFSKNNGLSYHISRQK